MGLRVHSEISGGVLRLRASGTVTLGELRSTLQALYSGDARTAAMDALWDFSQATMAVSSDDLEHLAEFVSHHWGEGGDSRSAIVAADDLAFGLARVYGARVRPRVQSQVRIFRDRERALAWLTSPRTQGGGQ